MNKAKIQLSEKERELVTDSEVILTKNRIIQKVYELFGTLADDFRNIVAAQHTGLPPEVMIATPKIARGENYLGLPYVMLDYPRVFERHNIFALRMMFWWGNFFSATIHMSGEYKIKYQARLIEQFDFFSRKQFYVCVSLEEWHHHFGKDNYQDMRTLTQKEFESKLQEKDFIKMSAKLPLTEWDSASDFFLGTFQQMLLIPG